MHSHYLSVPFPVSLLCSFQPVVTGSEGKQLTASCLLSVPKMLSQAGEHRCWYQAWGTPVMSLCFPAARHPWVPRTCPSTWCPVTHHNRRWARTVVSKGVGSQWWCPRSSTGAEGMGPGPVGRAGAGGAGGACGAGCAQGPTAR